MRLSIAAKMRRERQDERLYRDSGYPAIVNSLYGVNNGAQAAPVPRKTAGTVLARILKSSHSDHLSIYCMSSSIHFSNGMELLPLTCQGM